MGTVMIMGTVLVWRRGRNAFLNLRLQFIRMLPVQVLALLSHRVPPRRAAPRGRADGINNLGNEIAVAGAPANTNAFSCVCSLLV